MRADFHIHSDYSDGNSSPEKIVETAIDLEMDVIGIVDHVRAESQWVDGFSNAMKRIKREYQDEILVLCGLEAKCRNPQGELDLPPGAHESVDYIVGAIHRVPDEHGYLTSSQLAEDVGSTLRKWEIAVSAMLRNPVVDVWAHPGRLLIENGIQIPVELWETLTRIAALNHKLAESQASGSDPYSIPTEIFKNSGTRLLPASDSHNLDELRAFSPKSWCPNDLVNDFIARIRDSRRCGFR